MADVLAVKPEFVEAINEPELLETLPPESQIHRVSAFPQQLTRMLGFGGLAMRAGWNLQKEGERLLGAGGYDAVYFSSTVFSTFRFGPIWKQKFGIPYFVDFQDPWWSHYYKDRAQRPPGGWLKYGLAQRSARKNEGEVVREAAGVTCVSGAYSEMLKKRYPDTNGKKFLELPFGASEQDADLAGLRREDGGLRVGGREAWRYVGRGGADMAAALRIFAALLKQAEPKPFRLELMGTSYAGGAQAEYTMAPVLEQSLGKGLVTESPQRIGYLESIRKLKEADRLILFGSDDPGYTASKLYNYILAKRPLLVICREESSVARIVRETRAGELITFGEQEIKMKIKIKKEWEEAMGRWLAMDPAKEPATDWKAFEPYTARKMTEKLCRFFDERLEAENRKAGKIEDRRWEIGGAAGSRKWEVEGKKKANQPKVLLVHPGVQHAPRLAEALGREGLLTRFWTGWAKAGFGGGKRYVEIPEEKLRTRRWVEWAALALSKSGIDPETVWHWRNRIFQDLIPESEIEAADVVVGFDTGSWILAQRAKRLGKKFILDQSIGHPAARIPEMAKMGRAEETWGEPYQPRPGRLANWEKVEHGLADRIVVGSQFTRNTLIGQGVPAEKIRILPYGVGKEFVAAGEKRARDGKEGKIRFLFLGQLTQRKGMQFLLEAWKDLPPGKAELVLMGGGQRWGWKKQAGAGVTFVGQASRSRVLEEMGRSDVLILPSLFEGFGLVILEAMAAGLPVITTQNTGGPDVIGEGKEGFVVPAGNAEALREKMEWFIQNPEKAAEMGKAAHRKAKEFNWERYGAEYARIIREVVKS
jgi:glycosyltransferase involved in cell wall biosynthesis